MKESTNVSQQRVAHLQQVTWQNVNEPGAYVETGTGNLYRFPPEALIAGSSPVVRRENQDEQLVPLSSRLSWLIHLSQVLSTGVPAPHVPGGPSPIPPPQVTMRIRIRDATGS
jgi:hypothetical protein